MLTDEDCDYLASYIDFDDAINDAVTLLIANGVDDWEAFLKEKGILE